MGKIEELKKRLQEDDSFREKYAEEIKAAKEAGAATKFEAASRAAGKLGYEITQDDLKKPTQEEGPIADEDMEAVTGGDCVSCTSCTS